MRVSHNGKLIDEIAGSVKIIDDLKEQGHLDPSLALEDTLGSSWLLSRVSSSGYIIGSACIDALLASTNMSREWEKFTCAFSIAAC